MGQNLFFPTLWAITLIFQGLGHDGLFIALSKGELNWHTLSESLLVLGGLLLFVRPLGRISWGCALLITTCALLSELPHPPNNRILSLVITTVFAAPFLFPRFVALPGASKSSGFGSSIGSEELRAFALSRRSIQAIIIAIYIFAALAKINTDFLFGEFSCAKDLGSRIFPRLGAPLPSTEFLAISAIAIEFLLPLGLVIPATRHITAICGLLFHIFLTIDPNHRYYNFSSLMVASLTLFIRGGFIPALGSFAIKAIAILMIIALFTTNLLTVGNLEIIYLIRECSWFLIALTVFFSALQAANFDQDKIGVQVPRLLSYPVGLVGIVFVISNGIAPYIGVKTYGSWDMYSNLRMEGGQSNHLWLPRFADLSGVGNLARNTSEKPIRFNRMFIEPGQSIPISVIATLASQRSSSDPIRFEYADKSYICPGGGNCAELDQYIRPNWLLFFRPTYENSAVRCGN